MSTVMGIDLGIRKIAWSIWQEDVLLRTGAEAVANGSRPKDLLQLAGRVNYEASRAKPDSIWVEETLIGNNRKYSIRLSETMGAVLTQLAFYPVYTVNVSTWKKEVVGQGRADKNTVKNYMMQRDSAYAELCGNDQDRFDAACIGWFGVLQERKVAQGLGRVPSGDSTDA